MNKFHKFFESKEEFKELLNMKYEDFVKNLSDGANDPRIKPFLGGGLHDGKESDDKTSFHLKSLSVQALSPTQNEIDLDKSLGWQLDGKVPAQTAEIMEGKNIIIKAPIVTLNGKFILDGHHRWSQIYSFNKDATIQCYDIHLNVSPINMLKILQMSIANEVGYVPVAHVDGTNLLKANDNVISSYVENRISNTTLGVMVQYKKIEDQDKSLAANYVIDNIKQMRKTSQPVKGAPSRNVMPQTDEAGSWDDALKKGEINYKEPLDLKESSNILKFNEFSLDESVIKSDIENFIKNNNIKYDKEKDLDKVKFVDLMYQFLDDNPNYRKYSPKVTRYFKEIYKIDESKEDIWDPEKRFNEIKKLHNKHGILGNWRDFTYLAACLDDDNLDEWIKKVNTLSNEYGDFLKKCYISLNENLEESEVINELSVNDYHYKRILKMFDEGGNMTKSKIAVAVFRKPKTSRSELEKELQILDYKDIQEIEKDLNINENLNESRQISDIAKDIQDDWKKVNYAAAPYLEAMFDLKDINSRYYADDARTILLYFLSNAATWKGEKAKEIKNEIKSLLKEHKTFKFEEFINESIDEDKLYQEFAEGTSISFLAKKYNVSDSKIRSTLKKLVKQRGENPKDYDL